MVTQGLGDKRTTCVYNESEQQKHWATHFDRAFRNLTLMRAKKHWYLGWGTWLSCKNDVFGHMVRGIYEVCCERIKHTNRYRSNQFFLLSSDVHTTTFSSTLQDITGLSGSKHESFYTIIRNHVVPTHSDWMLNSWLSCSFFKHTCTFPPVTFRHSHWVRVWWVREFIMILLHKMRKKFDKWLRRGEYKRCFWSKNGV